MQEPQTPDICFERGNNWFRFRAGAIVVEDGKVLFVTSKGTPYYYTVGGGVHMGEKAEDCVRREVLEETGAEYEIDHLAVVVENFFRESSGSLAGKDCQCLEFYYLMKPQGLQNLISTSRNADDEQEVLEWIPVDKISEYDVKPSFLKERMDEILNDKGIVHIVTEADR